jgi:hypothetical protein
MSEALEKMLAAELFDLEAIESAALHRLTIQRV